jgi:hypothetical protein
MSRWHDLPAPTFPMPPALSTGRCGARFAGAAGARAAAVRPRTKTRPRPPPRVHPPPSRRGWMASPPRHLRITDQVRAQSPPRGGTSALRLTSAYGEPGPLHPRPPLGREARSGLEAAEQEPPQDAARANGPGRGGASRGGQDNSSGGLPDPTESGASMPRPLNRWPPSAARAPRLQSSDAWAHVGVEATVRGRADSCRRAPRAANRID